MLSTSSFRLVFWPALMTMGLHLVTAGMVHGQPSRSSYKGVSAFPEGDKGECLRELIDTLNSHDPERIRTFVTERFAPGFRDAFPMEDHIEQFQQVYHRHRELEFYGIRQYEEATPPGEIVAIVRSKLTDSWLGLVLRMETEPPHRLVGLQFAPARPPSDLPPPAKLDEKDLNHALKAYIDKLVVADAFSGTVLLAKDGKVLFEGAWGRASKRFNVANNIDTKFNLGSMNKMVTAVAIAQLVEQGKLAYDDPLSKHLSTDWLPRDIADKIRIGQLLSHTSGLGSYFNKTFMESSRLRFRTVDDFKPLVVNEKPAFEPGTDWSYSNTGFLLAGAVIEAVTGKTYFDYVRDNIFKPAGMDNTDSYEMDRPVPNLAIGYTRDGEGWRNNILMHVVRGGPAGGGYSTAHDLLKFDQALRSNKLISAESFILLTTPKPHSPEYGYGFGIHGSAENRIVGHSGGFPGISAVLEMYLDTGYTVIVLSNYDSGAGIVNQKIRQWLVDGLSR
jgi:CubicO group peptidase (beta-lactamase class C family)